MQNTKLNHKKTLFKQRNIAAEALQNQAHKMYLAFYGRILSANSNASTR